MSCRELTDIMKWAKRTRETSYEIPGPISDTEGRDPEPLPADFDADLSWLDASYVEAGIHIPDTLRKRDVS